LIVDTHSVSDTEFEANDECSSHAFASESPDRDMLSCTTSVHDFAYKVGNTVTLFDDYDGLQQVVSKSHYESSSKADNDEMSSGENFKQQLAERAVSYNIQQSAIGSLLKISTPHFPNLLRDTWTLLELQELP
jgi:hypothetical protein